MLLGALAGVPLGVCNTDTVLTLRWLPEASVTPELSFFLLSPSKNNGVYRTRAFLIALYFMESLVIASYLVTLLDIV